MLEVCRGVGAGGLLARVAVVEDGSGGGTSELDRMGAGSAGISDTTLASLGLLVLRPGTADELAVVVDPAGTVLTLVLSSFFPSRPRTSVVVVVVVVVVVTVETISPVSSSSTSPVLLFTAKLRSLFTPSICPSFCTGTILFEFSDREFEGASLLAYAESCTGPLMGDTTVGTVLELLPLSLFVVVLVFGASKSGDGFVAIVLPGASRSDEALVDAGFEVLSFFRPKIPLRRLLSFLGCIVSVSLPSVRTLSVDGLRFCSLFTITNFNQPQALRKYV